MKNLYKKTSKLLLLAVFLIGFGQVNWAQPWTENFNSQTSNSYGTGTITINGRDWTRKDAGNFSYANSNMGSYAFTINDDKPGAYIQTPSLNTCGTVSFKYAYINGNSTNVFVLQKSGNGSTWTDLETHTLGASSNLSYVSYSYNVNDPDATMYIRILSDDQNAHLFIEDFEVTAYSGSTNDTDSEVSASGTLSEPATISSLINAANGVQVFDFTFTDLGTSDGLQTIIDQLVITQGDNNDVADWTDAIAGAVLNGPDQTNMVGTVNPTNITFANAGMISIADNSNETYTLSIWLNSDLSGITDNDNLEFAINYTDITEDATGSSFGTGAPESGNTNVAISIVATELNFVQEPSNTVVNVAMSPDPTVAATDANGNIDIDYSTAITVTSDGTMTGDPVSGSWSSGVATFSNLTHTVVEATRTLTAESGVLTNGTSVNFDITDAPVSGCASELIISEYIEGSSNNKYLELYNGTGSNVDLSDYELRQYNNGSSSVTYTLTLSGNLADGATYVIENNNEALGVTADLSTNSAVMGFNGDDAIELYNNSNSASVDIIGKIGQDPGSEWGSGVQSTSNNSLVRNADITDGDIDGSDAFDPATEWAGYSTDDVSHLGSHTMNCVLNDNDSEASAPTGGQQSGGTISSLADTDPEAVNVFKFDIDDLGSSDGEATHVTNIRIFPGASNTADWTDHIQGLKLDNSGVVTIGVPTITDTYIDIPITSGNLDIADGTSSTITMSIYLNTSNIVDGAVLSFMIDADANGFTADPSGSAFAGTFSGGDVISNDFTIEVISTELNFTVQPTNTNLNDCMSPDVEVAATDENGNVDLDYSSNITMTSSGSLVGTPITVTAINGVATFSGANCIEHDVTGNNFILTGSDGSLPDATSNQFNIVDACATELFISEYVEGSSNNKYIEIFNGTGAAIDFSSVTYTINKASNGGNWGSTPYTLTGTLNDGDVFVFANTNADAAILAEADATDNSIAAFNGDDAIGLFKEGTLIDVIGVPTTDPGTGWDVAGTTTATANHTLIRKSSITGPQTNWNTSAGTDVSDSEWEVFAEDNFSNIGSHTITCVCTEPTVAASNLTFPSKTGTTLDLSWTSGDGIKRIVVARQEIPVSWTPTDGTTYSANSDFSVATDVGSGNKVVYNGSGNSLTVTGLNVGTNYYFEIFEYNCAVGSEDYLISSTLTGNDTTDIQNVTGFHITCITNTTAELVWDEMTGNYDGILIAVRESTLTTSDPSCDGSTLNSPNTDFSSALVYCGNSTDSRYVYNGTGTTVTITGLTPGADYVFKAYTYLGSNWTSGTERSGFSSVADVTGENATPSNATIRINWNNPTMCYDEIMVVGHELGSVSSSPAGDGSAYTANAVFGTGTNMGSNDYVVYKGIGTFVDVTSLTNGTNYCFTIFVRKGTEWSNGVEICSTPADVTVFEPGDFIVVGFDAKVNGGSNDGIYLMPLVDIKEGTKFLWINSRFEAGANANERTMHWGGGGDEPYQDPSYIEIEWATNGQGVINAGSIIYFETSGTDIDSASIDGVETFDLIRTSYQGSANVSASEGDQMWLAQGSFTPYGVDGVDKYNLFDGHVLYGLTSIKPWVPITSAVRDDNNTSGTNTGRESRIHPELECFNIDLSLTSSDYIYFKNGTGGNPGSPIHTGSKRNILVAIMSTGNWDWGNGTTNLDITNEYIASTITPSDPLTIGKQFTLTAGASTGDGTWVGGALGNENDWFHCANWEGLAVPDENVDVTIPNVADSPDIDATSDYASRYDYYAECNNLTIDGETLNINGSPNDTLFVHGDLLIENSGILNMDDGSGDEDGIIYLSGIWDNQASFEEGDGTIFFDGVNQQTISASSGTETFHNLTLNNTYLDGILTYDNIVIAGDFIQEDNTLNLNGSNIEIQGPYTNTNSYFIGNSSSDFTINGTGLIGDIYFKTDFNLRDFNMNRIDQRANLMTDLFMANDMNITNGGVNLNANSYYTVSGTLTNSAGANGLLIKSNASGTASLLHNTAGVEATCQRYMSASNWHYFFTPLDNADISLLTTTSGGLDNPNFYFYDETIADYWQGSTIYNPTGWTAPDHANKLLTNRGYIQQSPETMTYSLSGGNLFAGTKNFTLAYTDSGTGTEPITGTNWDSFEGWNLLGNPYPSAIDWNNGSIDKTYIYDVIYYYDDATDQYKYYGGGTNFNLGITVNGGSRYIPANQGFFVKALVTGNGQTFSIPNSARVHNAQPYWKEPTQQNPNFARLQISANDYTDETVIYADKNADILAFKMFAWDNTKPQLFSTNDDKTTNYAINNIKQITTNKSIPLGITIGVSGEYEISLTENTYEKVHIWLEDKATNSLCNMTNTGTYSFTSDPEITKDRFILHFDPNRKPVQTIDLINQISETYEQWIYKIPDNSFIDYDFGDFVTLRAELANGEELPEWITFSNGIFIGLSNMPVELVIRVYATDIFGEEIYDDFKLSIVENTTSIEEFANNTYIYPNPSKGLVNISVPFTTESTTIKVFSVSGKVVFHTITNSQLSTIDLSELAKGIYFVEINNNKANVRQKLIIE